MKAPIVIVGASAAGVSAALSLRENGHEEGIVLLSAEDRLPYERPAVSKDILLTGSAPLIVPEDTYQSQNIDLRLNSPVTSIRPKDGAIELANGQAIKASKILLATGGKVRRLTVPGSDLPGICYARTTADADVIRSGLVPGAKVVVVGGGLIGAEVAASAITAGCCVTWVEADYHCLTRALYSPLNELMMSIHRERGVEIETSATVTKVIGKDRAKGIELADGRQLYCDLLVVGIGIEPVVDLAKDAGATVGNGVLVNQYCETTISNIYAAGDVALHKTSHMAQVGRLEHWHNAQKQGAAAAKSMLGQQEAYDDLPWFWTDQYEHHIEGCGISRPTDLAVVRTDGTNKSVTVFYLRSGVLAAATTLNRPNDVRAAMRFIAKGLTPDVHALRDLSVDLRKLERGLANERT